MTQLGILGNNILKFPVKVPISIVGGNMKKVIYVKKISKVSLEKLLTLGHIVIIK